MRLAFQPAFFRPCRTLSVCSARAVFTLWLDCRFAGKARASYLTQTRSIHCADGIGSYWERGWVGGMGGDGRRWEEGGSGGDLTRIRARHGHSHTPGLRGRLCHDFVLCRDYSCCAVTIFVRAAPFNTPASIHSPTLTGAERPRNNLCGQLAGTAPPDVLREMDPEKVPNECLRAEIGEAVMRGNCGPRGPGRLQKSWFVLLCVWCVSQ